MDEILVRIANAMGLDLDLVRAIAKTESGYNPWAVRFEPAWRYFVSPRDWADKLLITVQTETMLQACSWGPMQIMGSVCREFGFSLELSRLTDPELSIKYACMQLKKFHQKYNLESDVIAAYNAGSAIKTIGGMYQNQGYVDKVHSSLISLRRIS